MVKIAVPGDKFIIEIENVYKSVPGSDPVALYKVKGFNTLVFDSSGLQKLERYQEPDKSSYFKGWDSGTEDGWQLAKKVANLPAAVREALFGYPDERFIFRMYSAEEAMKILIKYEEE